MKNLIRKILSEDFDWIQEVPSTPNGVKIGPPLSQSNPKNTYRVIITHGYGEDYGTWAQDWRQFDTQQPNKLIWYLKVLMIVEQQRELWDAINILTEQMLEGVNRWVIDKAPYTSYSIDWSDVDEDGIRDILSDLFYDTGIRQFDSYHQEDASLENYKVIYFDGYGIPHQVEYDRDIIRQTEL
jgi:hypothetical protein